MGHLARMEDVSTSLIRSKNVTRFHSTRQFRESLILQWIKLRAFLAPEVKPSGYVLEISIRGETSVVIIEVGGPLFPIPG